MSDANPEASRSQLFQVVPREATLATRVTRELDQLIGSGKIAPADRLPSERELAEQFGVSRTVVREAVRSLVARGLLEVRPGSGTVVRSLSVQAVSQSMNLFFSSGRPGLDYTKVNEVRRLLEIEIAGLAAVRRSAGDLQQLQMILDEMDRLVHDGERYPQRDVDFHMGLANATRNELLALLLESLADTMLTVRRLGFEIAGSPLSAMHHHRAIYAAVAQGNAEAARAAMHAHLVESEQVMWNALAAHALGAENTGEQSSAA